MTVRPFRPLTSIEGHLAESTERFDFIVTGDGRPPLPHMPYPPHALTMMREFGLLRPAVVMYTGDAFWGYDASRQEMLNDFDRFRALADTTGVPVYNVPGNHEMQSDPVAVELLAERGQDLYGSFDIGRYHFIALNTDEVCLEGRITGPQLEWLHRDLEQHREAEGIFVFMHRPMHSSFQGDFNPDDAAVLRRWFRRHPVRAVFAAHDHFFARQERGGVHYFTAGGGGGPMYTQPPSGGFAHYVLVTVTPGNVDYNVIEPGHLVVDHVAGNDGLEPVTVARVSNTTDRDLVFRSIPFRVPRMASQEGYELSLDYLDYKRRRPALPVTVRAVRDRGDGSVDLFAQAPVPAGVAYRIRVEARL